MCRRAGVRCLACRGWAGARLSCSCPLCWDAVALWLRGDLGSCDAWIQAVLWMSSRKIKALLETDSAAQGPAAAGLTRVLIGCAPGISTVARRVWCVRPDREPGLVLRPSAVCCGEVAPGLITLTDVGVDTAGQWLACHCRRQPEWLRSERSFARLCGVVPIPVSSCVRPSLRAPQWVRNADNRLVMCQLKPSPRGSPLSAGRPGRAIGPPSHLPCTSPPAHAFVFAGCPRRVSCGRRNNPCRPLRQVALRHGACSVRAR